MLTLSSTPVNAIRLQQAPRAAKPLGLQMRRSRLLTFSAKASLDTKSAATFRDVPLGAIGVFGLGLLAAAAVNVHTAKADVDLALGREVFEGNCAVCHAGGGNNIINDHTLAKDAIEKYLTGGYNITAITYQVTNGKGAMPAFGNSLDEEEIDAVANYVYKQAADGWK